MLTENVFQRHLPNWAKQIGGVFASLFFGFGAASSYASDWATNLGYRGVAITAYWNDSFDDRTVYREIDYFHQLGFNTIELVPTCYQKNMGAVDIDCGSQKTISKTALGDVIAYIKKKGMLVNLKPHVDPYPNYDKAISREIYNYLTGESRANPASEDTKSNDAAYIRDTFSSAFRDVETNFVELPEDPEQYRQILQRAEIVQWRAKLAPKKPRAWFTAFRKMLVEYLRLGMEHGMGPGDLFTVGTEMTSMVLATEIKPNGQVGLAYLEEWEELVEHLRSLDTGIGTFAGQLSYSAHEHEIWFGGERPFVAGDPWGNTVELDLSQFSSARLPYQPRLHSDLQKFWGLFSVVGMTAYIEVGEDETSKVEQAVAEYNAEGLPRDQTATVDEAAQKWAAALDKLSDWHNMIGLGDDTVFVFGEVGYRSVIYGHYKPYLPDIGIFPHAGLVFDEHNQRNCYAGMARALSDASLPWIKGLFLWEEQVTHPTRFSNPRDTGYSIIGKISADFFANAFGGRPDASIPLAYLDLSPDRLSFKAGGGNAKYSKGDLVRNWYSWSKLKHFSLQIEHRGEDINHRSLGQRSQVGPFYAYAKGGGQLKQNSGSYKWNRDIWGLSYRVEGTIAELEIDLGIGVKENQSQSSGGLYTSRQEDNLWYGSLYYADKSAFEGGGFELVGEWLEPIGSPEFSAYWGDDEQPGAGRDDARWEVSTKSFFKKGQAGDYVYRAGLQLMLGSESGSGTSFFYGFGPVVKIGGSNNSLTASFLYRDDEAGDHGYELVLFVDLK